MIYNTVCTAIERMGTEGTITEYESGNSFSVNGIIQPVSSKSNQNNSLEYTEGGKIDNAKYSFMFINPKSKIDYRNALLWIEDNYYVFKSCKAFYFKGEIVYRTAIVIPYERAGDSYGD